MNGILYFSSTGNSLYIAKEIKRQIGGEIFYIPNYNGNGSEFEKIILVTPIYSFGMPKHVYDLLPKLDKIREIIVIQNYGGMVGGADCLLYQYAVEIGLNIKSIYLIKMPENYTLTFTVPKFFIKSVLKKSINRVNNIIAMIKSEHYILPKNKKTKKETYLKNKSNWHIIGERFNVTDNCIKCQKCISLCPAKNITLVKDKITFGDNCVACLGCYHRCPTKSIKYLNKNKKYRYINPNINENEIGKDL